jgi:leucine dehydrogenase
MKDVMRLARGMTYKSAISKLNHGGGKSVIMRPARLDAGTKDRQELFEKFAEFLDSLHGKYLVAEDSGTSIHDMDIIRSKTEHVLGSGASGASGDPSPFTALGVRRGIEAAVKFRYGRDDMDGIHVALQGLGNVGYHLASELHELGASLTVTDVRPDIVERAVVEFGAKAVKPDDIYAVDADIFTPCALGAVINDMTLPQLKVDIVAGAANNQLAEDRHGAALVEKGILYAPDYAINAGGLINVASEFEGYDIEKSRKKTFAIYDTMLGIFDRAQTERVPTNVVADLIVEEIIYA